MRARGLMVVALGASLVSVSCKKTVEGENQAWTHNLAQVQQLAATYPSFANALHEQQKAAEAAMAGARELSDKEQSAKKMADANSLLSDGFVSTLSRMDSRQKDLRSKIITAAGEVEHVADAAGAKAATDDAQRILRNLDDVLKTGAPDVATATAVLARVDSDLSSAMTNVDRVLAAARARKQEQAKTAAAATAPAAGAAASPPVAKVQWKCTYCQHLNDDSRAKCGNCGAPRMAPKPAPPAKKK